jgi:CheY-like chemotaxis protein
MLKETASFALAGSNAQAVYRVDPDLWPLDVDTAQISQVIHNLVLNAAQAMPEGGTIEIGAANRIVTGDENSAPAPPGRWVALDVRDEGEGVPEALQANIFDPYFTTKDRGTGLGLSTSYAIVKNHGGRIELESQAGRGACFRVWLPAAQGAEKASAVTADHLVHGHGRILVMDDEEAILEVTREALDILGYQADVAKEGAEAIERYVAAMESGQRYDVVIMDLTIPGGLGGREVIRALLDIDPQIRAIVSSGYFQDPIMADYAAFGFKGVLPKPFRLEELGRALNRVLTSPDSPAA